MFSLLAGVFTVTVVVPTVVGGAVAVGGVVGCAVGEGVEYLCKEFKKGDDLLSGVAAENKEIEYPEWMMR
jgi:hypothetical protein